MHSKLSKILALRSKAKIRNGNKNYMAITKPDAIQQKKIKNKILTKQKKNIFEC